MNENIISQAELITFKRLQDETKQAKKTADTLDKEIKKQQAILISKIKENYLLEQGILKPILKVMEKANVAWKEKFIEFLGADTAQKVSESTPKTPYESIEITINV